MDKYKEYFVKHWLVISICLISITAFVFRIKCCYWGYPQPLHSDEPSTVNYAIEMLSRHSWEAHTYDRPDHFELKCNAIIFTIVSWIKYHKPAYEAFEEHKMVFHLLARYLTAVFGAALIPLIAKVTGRLMINADKKNRQIAQIVSAVMIAFSSIFIQHSAYATPDVVLTFFVILFTYGFIRYVDEGDRRFLFLCIVVVGIGITIKYTAAILCVMLAFMIIYRSVISEKRITDILKYGIISIGLIFATIFILAPNLITNIGEVYTNFIAEARPNHLGSDGLGFWGNLKYYSDTVVNNLGAITIPFFIAGLVYIFTHRSRQWLSMLVGLIFWICTSILSLHWLRWGIPIYPFYFIIVAVGISGSISFCTHYFKKHSILRITGQAAISLFGIFILLNTILSGLCIVKFSSLPDTRTVANSFLKEYGITSDNTLYEGYTPLEPAASFHQVNSFCLRDGDVYINITNAAKKYFMMSDSFKDRYLAESDKYPDESSIYNGIEEKYEIIYRINADSNYRTDKNVFKNIINSIKYLAKAQSLTGEIITIYDLNPTYITIQHKESGLYLSAASADKGSEIIMNEQCYQWVDYVNGNDTEAIISVTANMALDFTDAVLFPNTKLELQSSSGEVEQQWQLIQKENYYYLVNSNNMALSYINGMICLTEYTGDESQKWLIDWLN